MLRYVLPVLGLLSACGPSVPDSGASLDGRPVNIGSGVGFGSYASYEDQRLARETALAGGTSFGDDVAVEPAISAEELGAAGLPTGNGALPRAQPIGAGTPLDGPANPYREETAVRPSGPVGVNNPGISDEQSFEAVTSRESIESDAERLARQRAAYRVIEPTAVPTRSGDDGPNIVQYALSTTNARGVQRYRRGGLALANRSARACQRYPSPDLAQEAFLAAGGPDRDRLNLDPDGDGFACAWDPAPFRAALG